MPHICYEDWKPQAAALHIVELCNEIITEYAAQGFTLTLRQLYYQLVARDYIANKQAEYERLSTIVSRGRRAGMIDWDAIEDRTRFLRERSSWTSPSALVDICAETFHIDFWENQTYRPEVWIEKDALVGVFEGVCNELDIPFFSCRGYTSDSEMWRAGCRLRGHMQNDQVPYILHFGDHDPSGIDMTRDIGDRLGLFSKYFEPSFPIKRMALNMDQVKKYAPPPNPAKLTDARATKYIEKYGASSWELDALSPQALADLVRNEIETIRDYDAWCIKVQERRDGRAVLREIADTIE
mgnify:CR=1 FL=1